MGEVGRQEDKQSFKDMGYEDRSYFVGGQTRC